ncbi:ImmA/IrrE family metallo-endopeptidase [Prosthecobacter sp.]|uniref:ImmA/IrrE family metallo-endopeptidase n=1 Tax=Prosthecobacter sp. TaxID=1965333 RepID=UPI001D9DA484|nr:ImmA/IrrE family metallo-endopeptidase [Prosthecobacter sp.]MCB1276840.1 ImmA/IrrE family metallo-endopeptidase [Prosthecobacter sp.]
MPVRSNKLSRERECEIVELAEMHADEACPSGAVDPLAIFSNEEVPVIFGSYGEGTFDGMLEFKAGKFAAFCNIDRGNEKGTARARFTLAHELGHLLIPEHRLALMNGTAAHSSRCGMFDGAEDDEEFEADLFASNLLMPARRFELAAKKLVSATPIKAALSLKEQFKTSILSTAIRYGEHRTEVVALIYWKDEQISWRRIQDAFFYQHQFRKWKLDKVSQLPPDCATAAALAGSHSSLEVHDSVLSANFCFERVAMGGHRDLILREEALRLGSHGVLTVLSVHPKFPTTTPQSVTW